MTNTPSTAVSNDSDVLSGSASEGSPSGMGRIARGAGRLPISETVKRHLHRLGVTPTQGAELIHRLRMAAQLYDAIMAAKMRQGALSPPRVQLLLCLFAREAEGEASLNPTRLSRELGLSKNTISAHLRALEEAGLVQRDVDPRDLRQFQIRLAEEGRAWLRRSAPEHMRFLDQLVSELDDAESTQLIELLEKLIHVLNRQMEAGCGPGHSHPSDMPDRPENLRAARHECEGE